MQPTISVSNASTHFPGDRFNNETCPISMSNNHTVAMISKREVTSIFDNMPKHIYYTIRSSYKTLKVKKAQKDIQEYDYISENRHTPVHKTVMTSMVTCQWLLFQQQKQKFITQQ